MTTFLYVLGVSALGVGLVLDHDQMVLHGMGGRGDTRQRAEERFDSGDRFVVDGIALCNSCEVDDRDVAVAPDFEGAGQVGKGGDSHRFVPWRVAR